MGGFLDFGRFPSQKLKVSQVGPLRFVVDFAGKMAGGPSFGKPLGNRPTGFPMPRPVTPTNIYRWQSDQQIFPTSTSQLHYVDARTSKTITQETMDRDRRVYVAKRDYSPSTP
jgi:hypothetical protein